MAKHKVKVNSHNKMMPAGEHASRAYTETGDYCWICMLPTVTPCGLVFEGADALIGHGGVDLVCVEEERIRKPIHMKGKKP